MTILEKVSSKPVFGAVAEDFRSFLLCNDSRGKVWRIRGYGSTPEEAAKSAWERFHEDEGYWDIYC